MKVIESFQKRTFRTEFAVV